MDQVSHVTKFRAALARRSLPILAALAVSCAASPGRFKTPEEAVDRLVAAARADDVAQIRKILGPEGEDLIQSGDEVADRQARNRFVTAYDEKHRIERSGDSATLYVGNLDWPLPIPVVRDGDMWHLDAEAGREEMIARRVGENELNAIQVCFAVLDAQKEYLEKDRDGDGILEYARTVRSSPGKMDGLYWPTKEGEALSPLGDLAAEAMREGYSVEGNPEEPRPYHGYFWRRLDGQGESAPGGAYDYLVGEDLVGGVAYVAYPAEYGVSGVMSFLVSHDGVVYERDLGDDTEKIALEMGVFDPGPGWKKAPE